MEKAKRQANFELLRILAMFMVVCLHYLSKAGLLTKAGEPAAGTEILADLVESFCIIAVNVYVLITGYFLSKSKARPGRAVSLFLEILFYSLLIPVILMACGVTPVKEGFWGKWFYFLPVSMEHYWFMTAYVFLYLLTPFLNAGLEKLSRQGLKKLILALLFFTCFLPSVSPVALTTDHAGYDFGWFIVLYLIGGYLGRYGASRFEGRTRAVLLWTVSCLAIFGLTVLLHMISVRTGKLLYYAGEPFHYNFIFTLTGAIGLFLFVRTIKIPEGKAADVIRAAAPYTTGVYLIHAHLDVADRWLPAVSKLLGPVPENAWFLLHMLAAVCIVYVCCSMIDWVRSLLLRGAAKLIRIET